MVKKQIGLLTVLMVLLNLIIPSSILGFSQPVVPEGYSATAPEGVVLNEGEYYQQLTSFEGTGVKTDHVGGTRVYSDLNAVTGNKSFEITFNDGSDNAVQITEFRFGVSGSGVTEFKKVDFSQAAYLQFYINNTMETELQLDFIDLGNNGTYASIKSGVEIDFYNTTTEEWSKIVTKNAANPHYVCIPIAPQTTGFVRVPISDSVYNNMSAISLSIVDATRIWFQAPGCSPNSKAYIDEMGLVHVPEVPLEDRYEPYAAAQLQSDQAFKLITSFEGDTGVGNTTQYTGNNDRWSYVNTNQATGDTAVELAYNDGNVNGHINLDIPLSGTAANWSKADYLQFYVENTDIQILDIFYFKIITTGKIEMEIKNGAKGILFYDLNAKTWMELPVRATAKYANVHGIQFPSSAKGVVRIPLTSEVFSNFNANNLASMFKISLFTHIGGHSKGAKAYFDDFGLVSGPATTNKDNAPWSYTKSPDNNANLLQGQFFKLLTGFEGKGLRSTDIKSDSNHSLQYSDEHAGSGTKSAKLTFHNGDSNAIKITGFDFEYKPVSNDWSQAKYLQFYVNNPNNSVLHLGNIQYYYNGVERALKNGVEVYFCNADTRMWSTLVTKNMGNPAYIGVEIPANTRGVVRIPLNADTYNSYNQAEMGAVQRLLMFIQMPGCSDPSHVYIDDLGLIAGEDNVFPIMTDYEETDEVQLNPGEKFKLITGFEDETVPFVTNAPTGTIVRSTDAANNGGYSLAIRYTDGSASGHRNFSLDTSSVNFSDWSKAKYLQFYVKNTSTLPDLQLFYIQVNHGNKMVNYDAKGIKLFNIATGRWSDLEVVPNSDHYLGNTGKDGIPKVYVPTICVPANFEGYVRIPLTDENFTNTTLSEELPIITRFAMFSLLKGFTSPVTVYYDDFGLVTYEGEQAPDYVDYPVDSGEDEDKEDLDDEKDDQYLDIETIFSLSGTLPGLDEKPLANAQVTLNGEITVTTDSKGQYLFETVKTDLHELSVIGADDTDYGYITFEILTGLETRYSGTDIRIGHQENALIVNFKMGDLGPEIISVSNGKVTPEETYNSDKDDNSNKDNDGSPQTGVEFPFTSVILLVISFAAIVAMLIKRNCGLLRDENRPLF